MRVVTGATITIDRTAYASSRESRITGRRPVGGGSSAHQTSPRFTPRVPEQEASFRSYRLLRSPPQFPVARDNPGRTALRLLVLACGGAAFPQHGGKIGCES